MVKYIETPGAGIKMWTDGVPVEGVAMGQLYKIASMPFIFKHVAVMPDVHWGMGATVGSVIATKNAIIPAAVGVDIGCGMMALKTNLNANDLPDNLHAMRSAIEEAVPHGRSDNGMANDNGAWKDIPNDNELAFYALNKELKEIIDKQNDKFLNRAATNAVRHLGTLGSGNHFIELCLDKEDAIWIMLHSGSRGIGNRIGTHFIEKAKKDMARYFINLPDQDLAYLVEDSKHFDNYIEAVHWAQNYAMMNRELMMLNVRMAISRVLGRNIAFDNDYKAINCHHNYVAIENHFNTNVYVTRKGAVRARKGDLGIIPGSMGARSFIVEGKGNADSFCSCSHGAGRSMSRGEAKKKFSIEDHIAATQGVECRKDVDVIDETPGAYKDIDAVMAAQSDLVTVVAELKQILCVKG